MLIPTLLSILIVVVTLAFGGGVIALLAYGLGWLIHLVTKFDLFQSTLLGLAGMFVFGILAERIFSGLLSVPIGAADDDEFDADEYDGDFDDEYDDEVDDEFDDEKPQKKGVEPRPGIPLWRQPLKQVDFSKARPNDKCPCGSGRKFKNCHGAKRAN